MSPDSSTADSLDDLIARARAHAPFYQRLYEGQADRPRLTDLPVVDPDSYWQAHGRDRQEILTERQRGGFVLNSSGTSGVPKFLYSTTREWDTAVGLSARSFDEAGLRDGDRVATLFATGNLYASLLFATESFKRIQAQVVQFPVGYSTAFAEAARVIETFSINVLAGFPTHLLRVIDALDLGRANAPRLDHVIYAGELFTPDQQAFLQSRFPGLRIHSAGYASVEGGPIGYADAGCSGSEHRVYGGSTIVEILDEDTGETIEETGRPGRIVFTSLVRRLMPLIRFPTGDLAQWHEPAWSSDRKFSLLGRAGQGVRLATYNVGVSEVAAWLEPLRTKFGIEHFQLEAAREDLLDRLTFRLAARTSPEEIPAEAGTEILQVFRSRRPDIQTAVEMGVMHPPRVEWVGGDQLVVNERSGKMLPVIDRRRV